MIRIKYNRKLNTLKMKGHAGSAEEGKDLICAAATTLAYTLAQNLKIAERQGCVEDLEIILEPGDARISCRPTDDLETVQCMFETVRTGFLLLEGNYPDFIKFSEVG